MYTCPHEERRNVEWEWERIKVSDRHYALWPPLSHTGSGTQNLSPSQNYCGKYFGGVNYITFVRNGLSDPGTCHPVDVYAQVHTKMRRRLKLSIMGVLFT